MARLTKGVLVRVLNVPLAIPNHTTRGFAGRNAKVVEVLGLDTFYLGNRYPRYKLQFAGDKHLTQWTDENDLEVIGLVSYNSLDKK